MTSPYITIVGGTTLTTTTSGGPWSSEITWNDGTHSSTGAISSSYPIPIWQQGINISNNGGSTTMRNVPDVAMVANDIFSISDNGQTNADAGTSFAAPLWAGFVALVNQQAAENGQPPAGFINPAIYAIGKSSNYSACFHDITLGNNTNSLCPTNFFAVPGYDLCTGWGTPVGQALINALATPDALGITPATGFTAANGPFGPFNITNETLVLTNAGIASLNWSLCNTCVWLNASITEGTLLPGASASAVTVSLNASASGLAAGNYTANVWITNLTSGFVQTRRYTLQVGQPLIQNGDFEAYNFSGWLALGNWFSGEGGDIGTNFYSGSGNYAAYVNSFYGLDWFAPDSFLAQGLILICFQDECNNAIVCGWQDLSKLMLGV
jgi:subtilase family serine protease